LDAGFRASEFGHVAHGVEPRDNTFG
jgi:hypothetical protein